MNYGVVGFDNNENKDEMKIPFKSARTEAVRLAGLKDWEEWLFDDYAIENQGKTI